MRLRSLLLVLAAGCGGSTPPPPTPPSPPEVLVIPRSNLVIDTHLAVDVSVSGCDAVKSIQLADGQRLLGTADTPGPHVTIDVPSNQIDYKDDGIAAHVNLVATAACDNGTSATSPSVGVAFLPADTVFGGTFTGLQSLTMDTSFQGLFVCQNNGVVHLDLNGDALQTSGNLGFNCTSAGYTLRGGPNEFYWIEPGVGVARLNPGGGGGGTLTVMNSVQWSAGRAFLPADGSNPAVFFDTSGGNMLWLDRTSGQVIASGIALAGVVDGEPGLGSTGLAIPEEITETSGTTVDLQVEKFAVGTAASQGFTVIANTPVNALGTANVPVLNLSPAGTAAYFVAGDTHQDIWACDADKPCTDPSTGGGLIFKVTLQNGPYSIAQPLGSNVVAAGPSLVQFLDIHGSTVGNFTSPTGNLSVLGVYPGVGSNYFVADGDSSGNTLELVMLAAPGSEAARLTLNNTVMAWDVDDSGKPIVLVNSKLIRLLTPSTYLQAKQ